MFLYTPTYSDKARRWVIWFLLKLNLSIFSLFLILDSVFRENLLLLGIGFILFLIGAILVFADVQSDPYHMLALFKIQFLLWYRLQGPFDSSRPYIYFFPEANFLQKQDIIRTVSVQQQDLRNGAKLLINAKVVQQCPECNGKRNKPLTVQIECSSCQKGKNFYSYGGNTIPLPCKKCLGTGWIPLHPCQTCKGKGAVWQKQKIRVHIPPSSREGTLLRIPALGKINPETLQSGDLLLKLRKKFLNIF